MIHAGAVLALVGYDWLTRGDTTVTYAARKPAVEINRDDVRAEARANARANLFDSLYVGG